LISVSFHSLAAQEYEEIYEYYARISPTLAASFAYEVQLHVDNIIQLPNLNPPVKANVRRSILTKFPYIMYYEIMGNSVVILEIIHQKRQNSAWQQRR
jgi:plasmid stabilization system protein ParE